MSPFHQHGSCHCHGEEWSGCGCGGGGGGFGQLFHLALQCYGFLLQDEIRDDVWVCLAVKEFCVCRMVRQG